MPGSWSGSGAASEPGPVPRRRLDQIQSHRHLARGMLPGLTESELMKLFHADPPRPPPGNPPTCGCFNLSGRKHGKLPPRLHAEVQDTECEAWRRVVACIDDAVASGAETLEPLGGLTGPEREQIITLPAAIGRLTRVRELRLYGSHLVRLPPEIGGMTALKNLDVYTSYRLHFFPYELTRCSSLRDSRVSTRAVYGNYKYRPPFPALTQPENAIALSGVTPGSCSVCATPLDADRLVRRWITLAVGTDWLPLLVTACSMECIRRLPTPPANHVREPHTGGLAVVQPRSDY